MTRLRVLTWPDYALPRIAALARERLALDVEWTLFDRNEEAHELVAANPRGFDVVFADGLWPRQYLADGLIQPLDLERLAGSQQLDPQFRSRCIEVWRAPDGRVAAFPAYWGVRGLVIDADTVGSADSWETLWSAPAGSVWVNSQGTEVIAEAALASGCTVDQVYSLDDEQMARVSSRLDDLAPRLGGVWRLLPELISAFQNGALVAEVHSTSLVENVRSATGRNLVAVVPSEGSVAWVDGAMITDEASDPEAAAAFIDLMLSSDGVRIQWQASDGYWSTNMEAMRGILADPDFQQKAQLAMAAAPVFGECALYQAPRDLASYERTWERVLSQVGSVPESVGSSAPRMDDDNITVTTT